MSILGDAQQSISWGRDNGYHIYEGEDAEGRLFVTHSKLHDLGSLGSSSYFPLPAKPALIGAIAELVSLRRFLGFYPYSSSTPQPPGVPGPTTIAYYFTHEKFEWGGIPLARSIKALTRASVHNIEWKPSLHSLEITTRKIDGRPQFTVYSAGFTPETPPVFLLEALEELHALRLLALRRVQYKSEAEQIRAIQRRERSAAIRTATNVVLVALFGFAATAFAALAILPPLP